MIIVKCLHHPKWVGVDLALSAAEQWSKVLRHQSDEYLGMDKAACLFSHEFVPDPEPQKEHWMLAPNTGWLTPRGLRLYEYWRSGPGKGSNRAVLFSNQFSRKVD